MKALKWLSVSDRFAKTYLDSLLAPLGINSSQHMYLLKVCRQPGILQDSLLDTFYVHPSNIVRTVCALEKKGFLTREPYDKDKRTWRLYPTHRALAIAEQVETACRQAEDALMQGLDDQERQLFAELLRKTGGQLAAQMGVERKGDEFDV